jgi:hypothetical protein
VKKLIGVLSVFAFVVGCSSASKRKEARDKAAATTGLFCEFVNGEAGQDIDTALTLAMSQAMGQKCDRDKNFSITNYRTPSDIGGIVYCCGLADGEKKAMAKASVKHEAKADADEMSLSTEKAADKPVEKPAAAAPAPAKAKVETAKKVDPKKDERNPNSAAPVNNPPPSTDLDL